MNERDEKMLEEFVGMVWEASKKLAGVDPVFASNLSHRLGYVEGLIEKLDTRVKEIEEERAPKWFKVLDNYGTIKCKVKRVPIQWVKDHERQAKANHSQSVDQLNARGGLSPKELYAVIHDKLWKDLDSTWTEEHCVVWLEEYEVMGLPYAPKKAEA